VDYVLSGPVLSHLESSGMPVDALRPMKDEVVSGGVHFRDRLRDVAEMSSGVEEKVIDAAERYRLSISRDALAKLDRDYLDPSQVSALEELAGRSFDHKWQLHEALSELSSEWKPREASKLNKPFNKKLAEKLAYVDGHFHVAGGDE